MESGRAFQRIRSGVQDYATAAAEIMAMDRENSKTHRRQHG